MANITRFDPFSEMITPRQAMDRLFEDSFVSPLTLRTFNGDAAGATFEDGVLTLRIPKAEDVKPRQVEVKATPKQVASSTDGSRTA